MVCIVTCLPQANIVVTLGSIGAVFINQQDIIFQKAYPARVVDTTAAGDTFTGFLIGNLAQGKDIKEAMDLASKAAAISVTRKGAGASIPSKEEILNM